MTRSSKRGLLLALSFVLAAGIAPQPASAAAPSLSTATIASGLSYPWDIAFSPDGQMFVTERPGRVRVYTSGAVGASLLRTITVPGIRAEGEAGLMGIAIDIDYASNRYVYLCASRQVSGSWVNQVLRYHVSTSGVWSGLTVLLTGMQANSIHNGCALEMDRFARLWVSMGDAGNTSLSQNRNSLNGKILRINRNGSIPSDNPVIGGKRDAVYSLGHRNPQGIAIRPGTNAVYAVEHGPDVNDEVNLITPGGNYGWPCYTGASNSHVTAGCGPASDYVAPLWQSGSSTIATSGGTFMSGAQWADWQGHLWVSTLKERDLRRFSINDAGTALGGPTTHFDNTWGRLRAAVAGPGDQLYVTTSGGSGDRVIRISPQATVVARIAGNDRFATAAEISKRGFPGGASTVYVATGADYPDALAGGAAAGHLGSPVLLVQKTAIPTATRLELDRLNPARIIVLGGTGVIAESVRTALKPYASTGDVPRLAGADRYGTAAAISAATFAPGVKAAFIATGNGFADALAGAPAAALQDSPMLLVTRDSIPTSTRDELTRLNPQRIYVLGGGASISSTVASALNAYTAGSVTRLSGADRYGTGAAVVRQFWTKARAYVATGQNFPDALTGGALAGNQGVPVLLVAGTFVPLETGQEVLRLGPARLDVFGGTASVAGSAVTRLKNLIGSP